MADGLLTIQSERHAAREAAGEEIHRPERGYAVFGRPLTLPRSHVPARQGNAVLAPGCNGQER
jgi:hypothetical protein